MKLTVFSPERVCLPHASWTQIGWAFKELKTNILNVDYARDHVPGDQSSSHSKTSPQFISSCLTGLTGKWRTRCWFTVHDRCMSGVFFVSSALLIPAHRRPEVMGSNRRY